MGFLAYAVASALAIGQPAGSCIDPATPLMELAQSYSWPAPSSKRAATAFAELKAYLVSNSPTEYHKVNLKYHNLYRDDAGDAHVGLALGMLAAMGPDLNYPLDDGYRHRLVANTSNAATTARRFLKSAIERDSTQWIAAVALTRMALASTRAPDLVTDAVDVVDRALKADPVNTTLILARSDLYVFNSDYASALSELARARESCPALTHARAESTILSGDTVAGVPLYLRGLADAHGVEPYRYYDDMRTILTLPQRRTYNTIPVKERALWIENLWAHDAAAAGVKVERRIVEHVTRVRFADEHYRKELAPRSSDKPGPFFNDSTHTSDIWHDPGIVYVRHGEPDKRILRQVGPFTVEVWVYTREQPTWIAMLTHTPLVDAQGIDFWTGCNLEEERPILERRPVLTGNARMLGTAPEAVSPVLIALYQELATYDPRYGNLAKLCIVRGAGGNSVTYAQLAHEMSNDYRQRYRKLFWQESGSTPFARAVRMLTATYQFRDASGTPEADVLSWVPTIDMARPLASTRISASYTLTDSLTGAQRLDTVLVAPAPTSNDGMIRTLGVIKRPQMDHGTLRITFKDESDPGRGFGVNSEFTRLPEIAGPALSDIVLAQPTETGLLTRGAVRLSAIPAHAIRSGDDFRVFFEAYDLTPGQDVTTKISVTRVDRSSLAQMLRLSPKLHENREIQFKGVVERDARGISINNYIVQGDLLPGSYTVTVTLQSGGLTLHRSTTLFVDPAD